VARSERCQRGQSIALVAILMFAMIAMCAVAIDVGSWYQQKRRAQSVADASALAGAASLPAGWTYAKAAAEGESVKNKLAADSVTVTNTTNLTANDSVSVQVEADTGSFFARLFGVDVVHIDVTARATVLSYTGTTASTNVMPWGIMQGAYTPGSSYSLQIDNSGSPASGALDIPYMSGCNASSGSSDYRHLINGTTQSCPLDVGDILGLQGGAINGPTSQGINDRIGPNPLPADQIVSFGANGTATILKSDSPQLVLIPIVLNTNGTTTWPGSSPYQVKIVGFAWFVVTGYHSKGLKQYVDGVFVAISGTQTGWTTGAWNHLPGGATTIALTG
jgi:Flp pilus assembly protein TadG